ncbi:C40 family peptidase [Patescibacteria group bacterium]|nr:C40 family peptidase [Patescibacteria group bacterium]MBU4579550.1 C40 family peptidase [Patescibacteria group bacterium]
MLDKALILLIKKELKKIKTRYEEKYGAVIFDVKAKSFNGVIVLDGVVLSEKQKNEVFLATKEIIKNSKVENKIKVLSDSKNKLEIGWGVITAEVADIWAKLSDKKNIIGKTRASQALKGDFVRILARKGNWRLAQTCDLAIGWINKYQVSSIKYQVSDKKWIKGKRAKKNEILRIRLTKDVQKKFICFLKKYLNSRYLLGGMTERGIDCSGLAQKFYSDIFGILLPRHSGDQALCGEKIEPGAAHFGDLVFLRRRASKQAHIGVVIKKNQKSIPITRDKNQNLGDFLVLSAMRESGGVVIENLSEILKYYNLISIKRIISSC